MLTPGRLQRRTAHFINDRIRYGIVSHYDRCKRQQRQTQDEEHQRSPEEVLNGNIIMYEALKIMRIAERRQHRPQIRGNSLQNGHSDRQVAHIHTLKRIKPERHESQQ